jgi:hypothetical protein
MPAVGYDFDIMSSGVCWSRRGDLREWTWRTARRSRPLRTLVVKRLPLMMMRK